MFEARQRGLRRTVALKLLFGPELPDAAFEARFSREGRALAKLSHKNIVSVFDAGKSGPHYWLLMEYVDGPSLRRLLSSKRLTPHQVLTLMLQTCAALEYAHREGVVHRDIKPENILVTRQGRVKIADFGLAKIFERDQQSDTLTDSLQAMGTPHYVAPEQVETPRSVDHRADIYSLGVVLYEALSGELPIGRFALPSLRADVDPRFDHVVAQALEKDPDARYQAISEFRAAIRELLPERPAVVPQRPRAVTSKHALVLGVCFALLLCIWPLRLLTPRDARAGAPPPPSQLEEGRALLGSPATFDSGVALLEKVYQGSSSQEVRSLVLQTALDEIDANDHEEKSPGALTLGRLVAGLDPSPEHLALLTSLENRARERVKESVCILSPGPDEIVPTSEIVVRGQVDPWFQGRLLCDGEELEIRQSTFEHVLTNLADGPHDLELEARLSPTLTFSFPVHFVVDTTPPVLVVHPVGANGLVPAAFRLQGTVTDATQVTVALLDKKAVVDGTGEWSLDACLGAGRTSLVVTATDALRRTSEVTLDVLVDLEPPSIQDPGGDFITRSRPGEDWAIFKVTDDHGVAGVSWDGVPVNIDQSELVRVATRPGNDESAPTLHGLRAIDLAGNVASITVQAWRDQTPPKIAFDRKIDDAFPGSTFTLAGTVEDRSPCVVCLRGMEYAVGAGSTFEIPVHVPEDATPGTTEALDFIVRDRARNEVQGHKDLSILRPCGTCVGTDPMRGKCVQCGGAGKRIRDCEQCTNGRIIGPCTACQQTGKTPCSACNGQGFLESRCPNCVDGEVVCTQCDHRGRQELLCKTCRGTGKEGGGATGFSVRRCRRCRGTRYAMYFCGTCGGSKVLTCKECNRGVVRRSCEKCAMGWTQDPCTLCLGSRMASEMCGTCGGTGTLQDSCPGCNGTGTCPDCAGTGQAPRR